MDDRGFKAPGWLIGLISFSITCGSGVSWAYSTFVTIRERDVFRSINDKRLESIERKQDELNAKMDKLLMRVR